MILRQRKSLPSVNFAKHCQALIQMKESLFLLGTQSWPNSVEKALAFTHGLVESTEW